MLEMIKKKLRMGVPVIGVHARSCDSELVELMARCGNDFIWIEGEHSTLDKKEIKSHILMAQAGGAAAFVRVAWNDPVLVKPILEVGPDGIVFPMVRTADEALSAVKSCMYPPKGIRGFGPQRAMNYGMTPVDEYMATADDNLWKIIQIEHFKAVENLEEILEVPDVDAIVVGMMDLSGSIGRLAQLDHPDVSTLMDDIAKKAAKHQIPLGVSMAYNPKRIAYWIEKGIRWITVGADVEYVTQEAKSTLKAVRDMFSDSPRWRG